MNENWLETPNKLFELLNETYTSVLNTWLWSTQRALEFNKLLVAQLEANQVEGRKYIDEITQKTRQGLQIIQEVWQDNMKSYSTNVSAWRAASEASVSELNRRVEQMQQRFEASAN